MKKGIVSPRILRARGVVERTSLSRSTIHRLVRLGEFPQPFQLTSGTVAWTTEVVDSWIDERIAQGGAA